MIMSMLGRVPATGNRVRVGDYSIEVVDMDGRRVDKVLVMREGAEDGGERAK
jgi:putative hemolysin